MNKSKIREIIYIAIAIFLAIIAMQVVVWLLPIILVAILAGYIYHYIKNNKFKEKTVKSATDNSDKKKKTIIIDGEYSEK